MVECFKVAVERKEAEWKDVFRNKGWKFIDRRREQLKGIYITL